MLTVGRVTSFDRATQEGIVVSFDGKSARFGKDVVACAGLHGDPVGIAASFTVADRKGGRIVLSLYPERLRQGGSWPPGGEVARVICTVRWHHPAERLRFLVHPTFPHDVPLRPKGGHVRRDLRPGDPVIAEIVSHQGRVIALHAVRLPKNYATRPVS